MFSSMYVCLSLCLSVCLYVCLWTTLLANYWKDLYEIRCVALVLCKEEIIKGIRNPKSWSRKQAAGIFIIWLCLFICSLFCFLLLARLPYIFKCSGRNSWQCSHDLTIIKMWWRHLGDVIFSYKMELVMFSALVTDLFRSWRHSL